MTSDRSGRADDDSGRPAESLRREILVSLVVLFLAAITVAVLGASAALPILDSPRSTTLFLTLLVAGDLAVVFAFVTALLRRTLVRPVEQIVDDVERIASGAYGHRVADVPTAELQAIQRSVNALSDRLVHEQALLAENVRSLEFSNAALVSARAEVLRSARLASVGTLAAGIAHEVGNPLGAILGYVDVARSRLVRVGGDPALLDSIREEAGRIDRIVRGLLDYAHPREAEAATADPGLVVLRVRDLLVTQGKLDGIRHAWRVDDAPPLARAEPGRLEQVTVNLVLNALDALHDTPEPELAVEVTSEAGPLATDAERRENDPAGVSYLHRRRASDAASLSSATLRTSRVVVLVRVRDNGPGIAEDSLDRIFDPFFTTKDPGKGTGLGLSICARLVEGMGGAILAANGPEGGAVFTIRLPGVEEESAGTDVAASDDHAVSRRERSDTTADAALEERRSADGEAAAGEQKART